MRLVLDGAAHVLLTALPHPARVGGLVRDLAARRIQPVSVSTRGEPTSGIEAAISADGRYVAFSSSQSDLPAPQFFRDSAMSMPWSGALSSFGRGSGGGVRSRNRMRSCGNGQPLMVMDVRPATLAPLRSHLP